MAEPTRDGKNRPVDNGMSGEDAVSAWRVERFYQKHMERIPDGWRLGIEDDHGYIAVLDASDEDAEANARLIAAAPSMLALLRRVGVKCHRYGHSDRYDDPRRLRIDCTDDQCQNSEHTRYVQCDRIEHDIADLLLDIEAPSHIGRDADAPNGSTPGEADDGP